MVMGAAPSWGGWESIHLGSRLSLAAISWLGCPTWQARNATAQGCATLGSRLSCHCLAGHGASQTTPNGQLLFAALHWQAAARQQRAAHQSFLSLVAAAMAEVEEEEEEEEEEEAGRQACGLVLRGPGFGI